ncbi:MAG TPA: HAMP domain-containing sensor histidine kinase, partial [Kofleriaceae bacterium]
VDVVGLLLDRRVAIPVLVVRDGIIASSNEAARELLDGDVDQFIEALFTADSRSKLTGALAAAPASCEVQAQRGGRDPQPVRLVALPLGPDTRLVLVAHSGAEYSEAMAQQLLQANNHLANLTRELSRQSAEIQAARTRFESLADLREHFVSMLAHEVRGGLQGIALSLEVMERADASRSTELWNQARGRIHRSAAQVVELIEKVLEAARTESGRVILDARPVSIRAIARDALEIYTPIADRAGVGLELVDRLGDAVVAADRVRFGQVVGNLIENAIRHSPSAGTVTVELSATAQVVDLAVRDQGPGIPVELRERLFERFIQGTGKSGSLGLGLYVAHELVMLHGGRIRIEDVAPHGAALIVELPRSGES